MNERTTTASEVVQLTRLDLPCARNGLAGAKIDVKELPDNRLLLTCQGPTRNMPDCANICRYKTEQAPSGCSLRGFGPVGKMKCS